MSGCVVKLCQLCRQLSYAIEHEVQWIVMAANPPCTAADAMKDTVHKATGSLEVSRAMSC